MSNANFAFLAPREFCDIAENKSVASVFVALAIKAAYDDCVEKQLPGPLYEPDWVRVMPYIDEDTGRMHFVTIARANINGQVIQPQELDISLINSERTIFIKRETGGVTSIPCNEVAMFLNVFENLSFIEAIYRDIAG